MTDREKLIEILRFGMDKYFLLKFEAEIFAELLIANGVTFATDTNDGCKWISVEDMLPENSDTRVLVHINSTRSYTTLDTDRFSRFSGAWVRWGKEVTHWMPLPEPPKED